jgi:hypothetical protein
MSIINIELEHRSKRFCIGNLVKSMNDEQFEGGELSLSYASSIEELLSSLRCLFCSKPPTIRSDAEAVKKHHRTIHKSKWKKL